MRLRYAGVDVLLEDPDGRSAEYLRRYLSTENMRHWAENPMWRADGRHAARFAEGRFVGLPTPNFSNPPPVEVNTLYWPSGASRWARCLLLVNDEQWAIIREAVYARNENNSQDLEWWDEDADVTTTSAPTPGAEQPPGSTTRMFCLPPRPVTVRDAFETGERLLLLPLVDARYWWQFRSVEAFDPETWDEAYEAIEDALGIISGTDFIKSEVAYVYGKPSPVEFRRDYENAAMLLDAVAACVGHRIVRRLDGTVLSQSAVDANEQLDTNFEGREFRTAGGERADFQPAAVVPKMFRTTFKKPSQREVGEVVTKTANDVWDDLRVAGDVFNVTPQEGPDDSSVKSAHTVDAIRMWHCTAEITTTTAAPTTTPSVTTTLAPGVTTTRRPESWAEELTRQLAIDWIDWQGRQYDITLPGLVPWVPTGYDDWIQWTLGKIERFEDILLLRAATRVQSVPPNAGAEELPIDPPPGTTTTTTTTTTLPPTTTTPGPTTTAGPPGPTTTAAPPTTTTPGPCNPGQCACCPDVCFSVYVPTFRCALGTGGIAYYGGGTTILRHTTSGGNGPCYWSGTITSGAGATLVEMIIQNGYPHTIQVSNPFSGAAWPIWTGSINCAGSSNFSLSRDGCVGTPGSLTVTKVNCASTTPAPDIFTTYSPTTTTPLPTTTFGPCTGQCSFVSVYDADSGLLAWSALDNDCSAGCGCDFPPDCPTGPGQTAETNCISGATSPPAGCTTSTAAPTTTTVAPCTGTCLFQSVYIGESGNFQWIPLDFQCSSGCGCQFPESCPTAPDQIVETNCGTDPTTHPENCTTAGPTTTAAPTTTTPGTCGGTGTWYWNCDGGNWAENGGDGTCSRPAIHPDYVAGCLEGEILEYNCTTCLWQLSMG